MLRLFQEKKGTITVFVTLIMVPTIFFMSFMVDLARIKLVNNQAVMTADNYGQTVLTYYDNVLKELYGLFSVTQNTEALAELDKISDYMKTSFDPDMNAVTFQHFRETQTYINSHFGAGSDSGFAPYRNADVTLEKSFVDGANLGTPQVFCTQVGDFMKFRIAQCLADNDDIEKLINTIETVQNLEETGEVIKKRNEIGEALDQLFFDLSNYYNTLEAFYKYKSEHLNAYTNAMTDFQKGYEDLLDSDKYAKYKTMLDYAKENNKSFSDALEECKDAKDKEEDEYYKDYEEALEEYNQAVEDAGGSTEGLTEPDKPDGYDEYIYALYIYDEWDGGYDEDGLKKAYYELVVKIFNCYLSHVDFKYDVGNLDKSDIKEYCLFLPVHGITIEGDGSVSTPITKYLTDSYDDVKQDYDDIVKLKDEIDEMLKSDSIDVDIKEGIKKDLERVEEIGELIGVYKDINDYITTDNSKQNQDIVEAFWALMHNLTGQYGSQSSLFNVDYISEESGLYPSVKDCTADKAMSCKINDHQVISIATTVNGNPGSLADLRGCINSYKPFYDKSVDYKNAFNTLKSYFDSANGNNKDKYEEIKNDAKSITEDLNVKDDPTDARNIPDAFGYGKNGGGGGFDFGKLMETATSLFSAGGFEQTFEKLFLKFYLVEYDFHMFSDRITPVKKDDDGHEVTVESLTGYEMSRRINYLYGAELEYILNGDNSSQNNLNSARDKILAFRAVMNFAATYQIESINQSINVISDAAAAFFPPLGIVVNGLLRLAVAGVETYYDWEELKKGNDVFVIKDDIRKLTFINQEGGPAAAIRGLFGKGGESFSKGGSGEPEGLKLDYDNYLMIIMLFLTSMDDVTQRSANLIELNVNNVEQAIPADKELSELTFHMSDAHTAVNTSCTVHIDFLVIPMGFAKDTVDDDTYSELTEFENNLFKYTVTRGY